MVAKGDIKVRKYKKTFECWVKSLADVPDGAQDTIKTALTTPQQNFGKDNCIIDLVGPEKTY